jgi:hypothetical protein
VKGESFFSVGVARGWKKFRTLTFHFPPLITLW